MTNNNFDMNNSSCNSNHNGNVNDVSVGCDRLFVPCFVFVFQAAYGRGGGLHLEWMQPADGDEIAVGICLTTEAESTTRFSDNSAFRYGGGGDFGPGCEVALSGDVFFESNTGKYAVLEIRGGAERGRRGLIV